MAKHRVVIVGGGAAGLFAARTLAERGVDFALFEAAPNLGGNAYGFSLDGVPIDTGVMFYHTRKYPRLTELLTTFGLRHRPIGIRTTLSVDGRSVLKDSRPSDLAAAARLARGFIGAVPSFARARTMRASTVRAYLEATFPDLEARAFAAASLCGLLSCRYADLGLVDVDYMVDGLASIASALGSFCSFDGGTERYLEALTAPIRTRCHSGQPVLAVRSLASGYRVALAGGHEVDCEQVVFATPPHRTAEIWSEPPDVVRESLKLWPHRRVSVAVHDGRTHGQGGAIWNHRARSADGDLHVATLVDMALLHGDRMMRARPLVDVDPTLGAAGAVNEGPRLREFVREVVIPTPAARNTLRRLEEFNRAEGPVLAGAYLGFGSHEDALVSGESAARHIVEKLEAASRSRRIESHVR